MVSDKLFHSVQDLIRQQKEALRGREDYMIKTTTPEKNTTVRSLGGGVSGSDPGCLLEEMQLLLLLVTFLLASEADAGECLQQDTRNKDSSAVCQRENLSLVGHVASQGGCLRKPSGLLLATTDCALCHPNSQLLQFLPLSPSPACSFMSTACRVEVFFQGK